MDQYQTWDQDQITILEEQVEMWRERATKLVNEIKVLRAQQVIDQREISRLAALTSVVL